ncbi:guanylate-binding protein 1-like [Anolis sagrei]|uniref:guanylate-binding protein 1-like n=1 Tax=Anolis sagrei TaxID=38937 RepID=UPI00351FEC09
MATPGEAHMDRPLCLIENHLDGRLVLGEEALAVLQRIRQPVVMVAIVGPYRTGKSYLMNRLAGQRKGFSLGSTVQDITKGIWMWCRPHPHRSDHTLVLLDTEGLGDVEKGNTQNDAWIFALAILLSSTLVYNSMGTIDQDALEKLHYVSELTQKIRVTSSRDPSQEDEDASEFVCFFPDFIWAVRDFMLDLEINGRLVSEDGYLEHALKLRKGDTEQIRRCNLPRLCIRKFFPSRKCFTFDRPAGRKKLRRLEELEEEDLEEEFLESVARFCDHVWETSKRKTVPGGQAVTGAMLANLAKAYVGAINSGEVPCLENAFLALAEIENAAAVREALSRYEEEMQRRVELPTGTVEELLWTHAECEREAARAFMARAFGGNIKKFQVELTHELNRKKEEFLQRNEAVSFDRCMAALENLSQDLESGVRAGRFSVPGGYQQFLEEQRQMVEKYRLLPDKGVQADKALEGFLKSKETEANSILLADMALSEKEKEVEAQRVQTEAAQRQQELLEQELARKKQLAEDQERSYEEQIRLLREKVEEETERMKEETERIVQLKLQEQKKLLEEGFCQKAKAMEDEIQKLKENDNSVFAIFMSTLEKALSYLKILAEQEKQSYMVENMAKMANASAAASAPKLPKGAGPTKK